MVADTKRLASANRANESPPRSRQICDRALAFILRVFLFPVTFPIKTTRLSRVYLRQTMQIAQQPSQGSYALPGLIQHYVRACEYNALLFARAQCTNVSQQQSVGTSMPQLNTLANHLPRKQLA